MCLWWQISELIADEIAYWILYRKRRREHQQAEETLAALKANLERYQTGVTASPGASDDTTQQ